MLRSLAVTVLLAMLSARSASAQIPPHATCINPNVSMRSQVVLHDGDDLHAFGSNTFSGLLHHAKSCDGGRTWPVREVLLGSIAFDVQFSAAVATPGNVLVLANAQTSGPLLWRSVDRGLTWLPAFDLFNVPGNQGDGSVALVADGADVVAVWLRGIGSEVRSRRSSDGGASWSPVQVLDPGGGSGNSLRCLRNGNTIDVFWKRYPQGAVHQRSTDGGASWLPAIRTVAATGPQHATSDGTNLMLVTVSDFLRSADGGQSWMSGSVPGAPYLRSIDQEGALVAVVAVTTSQPFSGTTYVVSVSTDGGANWSPNPLMLPSPVVLSPEVKVVDGIVYVRFSPGDQLDVVTSLDAGANWQIVRGPVTGGLWPGARRNVHMVRETGVPSSFVRFYAYCGIGHTTLGSGTVGTGGATPRLFADGLPFRGSSTTLRVVDAVGGSIGAIAVSFAAPMPVAIGTAVLWPTVTPSLVPFASGGAAGLAGAGSFALPVVVPNDPTLVGLSLTAQAIVVDSAGVDGWLAVSNAIELWLR